MMSALQEWDPVTGMTVGGTLLYFAVFWGMVASGIVFGCWLLRGRWR